MIIPYRQGVVIDLGTGDGCFVYQLARQKSEKFYIGMDANVSALAKISEKIHRKPALSNALYVHATVEELPSELDGVANEVHVHLPWGSLLREVLKPRYKAAGFEVLEMGMFASGEWPSLHTSWAKRLRNNRDRSTIYIVARALASPSLE